MPLTIHLRNELKYPLDVAGAHPAAWENLSLRDIEAWPTWFGNRQVPIADFFAIQGTTSDGVHQWQGDLGKVHNLGAGHSHGSIEVDGNAGRGVGQGMAGGELLVRGRVGDLCGSGMRGGLLRVLGDAGDRAGGAMDGRPSCMQGGELIISGDAGKECGYRVRSGMIVVGGTCGNFAGYQMRAGTVVLGGACGSFAGLGMRRGTLLALSPHVPIPTLHFRPSSRVEPLAIYLVLQRARRLHSPLFQMKSTRATWNLFHGDLLEGGRGELYVAAESDSRPGTAD